MLLWKLKTYSLKKARLTRSQRFSYVSRSFAALKASLQNILLCEPTRFEDILQSCSKARHVEASYDCTTRNKPNTEKTVEVQLVLRYSMLSAFFREQ